MPESESKVESESRTTESTNEVSASRRDSGRRMDAMLATADNLDRIARATEVRGQRWELVVYPALFAFITLAAYGFYLIYNLTNDVALLARSVDRNMVTLTEQMERVTASLGSLTLDVHSVAGSMTSMTTDVRTVATSVENLDPMLTKIDSMKDSMRSLSVTTHHMRGDVAYMGQSIGRPMSMMTSFMPF